MPEVRLQSQRTPEQHTCPMCVGPYPFSVVTVDPTGAAAQEFATRDRGCPGCDGRGLASCALCRRDCGDFKHPDPGETAEYCFACASAPGAPPELRRCLDAVRHEDGTGECRWGEVDWLDAA